MSDRWPDWCELLDAIESGERIPPRLRAWFLLAAREWSLAAGERPLHVHLGLTRRRRQDYVQSRQRILLARLARLLDSPGSSWHRAEIVAERIRDYYAGPWKAHRDLTESEPGWSALTRALFELWRLPIKPPTSTRGIHRVLTATSSPMSLDRAACERSNTATEHGDDPMLKSNRQFFAERAEVADRRGPKHNDRPPAPTGQPDIEAAARAEFARDARLRDEFCGDMESYVAFKRAETAGRIRRG